MRVTAGPFRGHLGLVAGMAPRERVIVLLSLLGSQQRVSLPEGGVEAVLSNPVSGRPPAQINEPVRLPRSNSAGCFHRVR